MRNTIIGLLVFLGACCTSDDNMCIASATDTSDMEMESTPAPTEAGANCCAVYGTQAGKDNICAISDAPFCVGCDGEPVLCMTTGCGVPFTQDCCLVGGETVTCPR